MSVADTEILVFDTELKEQRSFWIHKLSREHEVSSLSPDYERPKEYVRAIETVSVHLEGELYRKLCKLTGRSPFLLYTTLMASLKICLNKYHQGDATSIGSPALEHIEGIKQKTNALVILNEIDAEATFRQLLLKVRETLLEAYAKHAYPFSRLLQDLGHGDCVNKCPLFDVALVLKGLHGELPEVRNDLTITFEAEDERASGEIAFNSALFEKSSIERFARHLVHILGEALDNPNRQIKQFEMLTEAERRLLLEEYNETARAYPQDRCFQELFEAQVEATPSAVALVCGEQQIGYRELNERANRLAHYLLSKGVGPEVRVGISVGRSVAMVVAVLGVLKAGGAYVPLDFNYPQDRLAFMLSDAGISVLLTERHLLHVLPAHTETILCLDDETEEFAHETASNPPRTASPMNTAYVIYTSGSTGRPKGVMIQHRGLVNYLSWCVEAYRVQEGSGAPVHSPLGFDLTVTSLFAPLLAGRHVLLLSERDGVEELGRVLRQEQDFSLVKLTPAHLEVLGQLLPAADGTRAARCLVLGGEALHGESLEWWRVHAPTVRVVNEYGPTETVVGCCVYEAAAGEIKTGPVPIGRPVANTELYVLDRYMQPVAIGVTGELYIGGDGLARGYLNRPGLTAERFVPHPFSREGGQRLYRTGDVVRYGREGELEYVGRVDQQVKVRGFRIELGEIETVLLAHPSIYEAVVIVRADREGSARLIAYVVAKEGETVTLVELRDYLKEKLPDYMIPSAFVLLDELPLTTNGKVNRRLLPEPPKGDTMGEDDYVAPRNELEEMVAGIWSEVLKVERVGAEDNFFELGGHSLLATQIISRVREVLDVGVALRTLFESPTVGGLAAHIESAQRERWGIEQLPPLVAHERQPGEPFVLSYAQQRLWLLHQLEPGNGAYNVPVAARLSGHLDIVALEQTLDAIAERHEILRTTFAIAERQPRQFVKTGAGSRLTIVDLTELHTNEQEHAARRLTTEEVRRPFDLARGPLFRARLLRLGEEEHILLLTMHHIVADGWSMDVLVRELAAHYKAFATGTPATLPPLPVQYADFAIWQRQLEGSAYRAEQLSYWKRQLRAPLPTLDLPTDYPRPAANSYQGETLRFRLSLELSQALHALSRQLGATLYMTLLAAFKTLLYRYTGQADLIVGTPVANRERAETQDLLGCLINTLAVRTDVSGNPDFAELVGRVREVVLSAHAHGEVAFERVVEALGVERSRGNYNPLFQVWFVLLNVEMEKLKSAGLEIRPLPVDSGTVQFDLVLSVEEREGGLHCEFAYSTDLFDALTIEALAEHYLSLLEQVARGNTSCGILDIPLSGEVVKPHSGHHDEVIIAAPPEEQEQYAL
jgi:amino acid adenylation domain-containing protein